LLWPSITQGGKLPVSNPPFWIIPLSQGVGVGTGVGVAVGLAVGVGVGVGGGTPPGAWITTTMGEPVLKKPTVASVKFGAWSASNRKLYNVPKRIALAF